MAGMDTTDISRRAPSGARALFVAAIAALAGPPALAADAIAPFKDDLFATHKVKSAYGGDLRYIEYERQRDLYGRDEVPEKKAFAKFVTIDGTIAGKDLVLGSGSSAVRYVGVGKVEGGARFVLIFLHGDKGSRHQAMDDWSFGGNFNRLKNLVVRSGGAYLSADFSNFGKAGTADVVALMKAYAANSPGAPIIVACTSRSGELCFRLFENGEASALLDGVILLGSGNEDSFFTTPVFTDPARHIPIFIGHGSSDKLITWVTQELFFKKVKAARPDYPVRFDVFVSGAHGTPMRLTDWRRVLNWMIAEARKK